MKLSQCLVESLVIIPLQLTVLHLRVEHVCNRVLASVSSDTSRRWRTRVPYSRAREWTIFFVLIDYQEDICESVPLYDYQKLFLWFN